MARLYEFVIPVRRATREEFAQSNPHPFLLGRAEDEDTDQSWTFKTQTVSVASAQIAKLANDEEITVSPEVTKYDVFPVTKAIDNPWPERISVGRARNNDIVLLDSSVSKLHAHFRLGEETIFLVDAGSRNGTRLNDQLIQTSEVVPVAAGDTILFGRTSVTLLDAERLYDLVARFVTTV